MATTVSSSSSMTSRPTHSCIRCADRKVKCDRQRPCSACVKHNVDCTFNPLQPLRKRQRRVKNEILIGRLRLYEAVLQEQGIDPNKLLSTPDPEPAPESRSVSGLTAVIPNEAPFQTPSSTASETGRSVNKTQLVHNQGRFKFVDK